MSKPKITRSKEELEAIVQDSPVTCELHEFDKDTALFYFAYKDEVYQVIYPRKELDDAGIKEGMNFQIHFSIKDNDIQLSFVPKPHEREKKYEAPEIIRFLTTEEKLSLGKHPWEDS
jgi:hypothetical protein